MSAGRGRAAGLAIGLTAALAVAPVAAQRTDPFYGSLAEDGIRAYERGEYLRASENLRVAAFGLLATPDELARALAYLALARSAAGDDDGFERAYGRLTDLESRFQAFSRAALEPEVRAALANAARTRLGETELAAAPASPPRAAADATRPRLCVSWSGDGECRQVARGAAEVARRPAAPAGPAAEELAAFERLDALASGPAGNRLLRAGYREASALADSHPEWREMQRLAAVLASRSGAFADAVRYDELAGSGAERTPRDLFYLAVALFETDRSEAAAAVLRQALPALESNREVRKYVKRILPEESAG